jgi:hypothetical protein
VMHGHEKSDPAIVAVKPTNKAERSAAELVEPRVGTEGNADLPSTHWTQRQARVPPAGRMRQLVCRLDPRWEKLWGGRRRLWHLHRPYEPMEVAPWPKSMISAEA